MTTLQHVNPKVKGIRSLPQSFKNISWNTVIDLSSGDPQKTGLKPLSSIRQVLACCICPQLLDSLNLSVEVCLRAQKLIEACAGSVGSYTGSSGLDHVRQSIAEFITKRDGGVPSCPKDIIITVGSQRALMVMLKLIAGGEGDIKTGVLSPVPCPHTLPMVLEEAWVTLEPYHLLQDQGWALDMDELHRTLAAARGHCKPRALFISNPGNPTGHVQDKKSIQEVIQFAEAEGLLLLVDEVYQDTVFGEGAEFISYKKVLFEMGAEYSSTVEMMSLHSTSSIGECGLRAGYVEVINMDPEVKHFVDIMLDTDICTPVLGQLALDLMVSPLKCRDSCNTYTQETAQFKKTLEENCQRACEVLNNLPGMSCQPVMGGIYLYPLLNLPTMLTEQAKKLQVEADVLYCQMLLEEDAVLLGSGRSNGQPAGRNHLRLCILVPPDVLEEALTRLKNFHHHFMESISLGFNKD